MNELKQRAFDMFNGLKNRPEMMALTREGFALTVITTLDLAGINTRSLFGKYMCKGSVVVDPDKRYDHDWAVAFGTEAEQMLKEHWNDSTTQNSSDQ